MPRGFGARIGELAQISRSFSGDSEPGSPPPADKCLAKQPGECCVVHQPKEASDGTTVGELFAAVDDTLEAVAEVTALLGDELTPPPILLLGAASNALRMLVEPLKRSLGLAKLEGLIVPLAGISEAVLDAVTTIQAYAHWLHRSFCCCRASCCCCFESVVRILLAKCGCCCTPGPANLDLASVERCVELFELAHQLLLNNPMVQAAKVAAEKLGNATADIVEATADSIGEVVGSIEETVDQLGGKLGDGVAAGLVRLGLEKG